MRSDLFDWIIQDLCGERVPQGLAVAAVGGYGRREQAPGSDVDLMFLHVPGDAAASHGIADTVLYPLWDSGLQVSHAVRTPVECTAEATSRLESLTALLDARRLAGSPELVNHVREGAVGVIRQEPAAFVDALRRSREERDRRYGSVGRTLDPDLKEGLGGLRDIQILRWLAAAGVGGGDGKHPGENPTHSLTRSLDHLLLVRWALHLASSSRNNRLAAELHEAVAAHLGIEGRPGWEARDDIYARRVRPWSMGRARNGSGVGRGPG
jgi:[protein-PII] uridylyltransferase